MEVYQKDFIATYPKFVQDFELCESLCERFKTSTSAIGKLRYEFKYYNITIIIQE